MIQYKPTIKFSEEALDANHVPELREYLKSLHIGFSTDMGMENGERMHTIQILDWVDRERNDKILNLFHSILRE